MLKSRNSCGLCLRICGYWMAGGAECGCPHLLTNLALKTNRSKRLYLLKHWIVRDVECWKSIETHGYFLSASNPTSWRWRARLKIELVVDSTTIWNPSNSDVAGVFYFQTQFGILANHFRPKLFGWDLKSCRCTALAIQLPVGLCLSKRYNCSHLRQMMYKNYRNAL